MNAADKQSKGVKQFEERVEQVEEILEQIEDEIKRAETIKRSEFAYDIEQVESSLKIVRGQVDKYKKGKSENQEALAEGIEHGLDQVHEDAKEVLTKVIQEHDGALDTRE